MSTIEICSAAQPSTSLTTRQRWIDIVLVVGICLYFPLTASTHMAIYGANPEIAAHSNYAVFLTILYEISGLAVLGYVLSRRQAKLSYWGHAPERRDFLRTLILYAAQWISGAIFYYRFEYAHFVLTGHYTPVPSVSRILGMHASFLWLIYPLLNPWFEELVFRGFLINELPYLQTCLWQLSPARS